MFTGIVETTGVVEAVDADADGHRLSIAAPFAGELTSGDSVSVSGACLTVEAADTRSFAVFLAAETRSRTSLDQLTTGDRVNLERAMPAAGRFDGHLVQGHVDATTELVAIEPVGEDWTYTFALPAELARYVVEKGSIALDGVSLTVSRLNDDTFSVAVIPTTYRETTLGECEPGRRLNVEVDILAKYVERQVAERE